MTADASRRWLPITLLALAIAGGTYLRFAELGTVGFGPDELNHYFVAQSLEQGEGPRLPSGAIYTRGIDVSRLVGLSVKLFGPSEFAVRLPTAVFGVLNLLIFAGVLWALGGPWVAVWGTVLLAIYPQAVSQSRILRFYTYQLNFGLIALLAGWYSVRGFGSRTLPEPREVRRQWLWAGVTMLALLLATRIQVVTLSVAVGWATVVAIAAACDLYAKGWRNWRRSVPMQLAALGVATAVLAIGALPTLLTTLLENSRYVPLWVVAAGSGHPLTYYYALSERFPLLVSLSPLVFILLAIRQPRLSLYLAIWFAVPVLLHSFVFTWKGERFILLAVPALFTATAFVAAWGASVLYREVRAAIAAWPPMARFAGSAAVLAVAIVSLSAIVTTPAFNMARKMVHDNGPAGAGWKQASAILESRPDLAALPIGSSSPLQPLYYVGRLDFYTNLTDDVIESESTDPAVWLKAAYDGQPPLERKSGAPVLPTAELITKYFADRGGVVIVVDTTYVISNVLDRALVARLESDADELCRGKCGGVKLFVWTFGERLPMDAVATAMPTQEL